MIIEAVKDSSYYVSVKRKQVSLRVYEGIPMVMVVGDENRTVEFVNINDVEGGNVSVLVEVRDSNDTNKAPSSDSSIPTITVTAEVLK